MDQLSFRICKPLQIAKIQRYMLYTCSARTNIKSTRSKSVPCNRLELISRARSNIELTSLNLSLNQPARDPGTWTEEKKVEHMSR